MGAMGTRPRPPSTRVTAAAMESGSSASCVTTLQRQVAKIMARNAFYNHQWP